MKRTLMILAGLLCSIVVFTPSASAGPWDRTKCTGAASQGVRVCFDPWNDKVWVQDTRRDGASAAAEWHVFQGRDGRCINSKGAGTWRACDYNFSERWKRWDGKRCPRQIMWRNWTVDKSAGWHWKYQSGPHEAPIPYHNRFRCI